LISLEEIIKLVVKEVIKELQKKGIQIDSDFPIRDNSSDKYRFEMEKYKSKLLTESNIAELGTNINEIEIPKKTIITPSAKDLIRKRKIKISYI